MRLLPRSHPGRIFCVVALVVCVLRLRPPPPLARRLARLPAHRLRAVTLMVSVARVGTDKPRYTSHICGSRRGTFPALFTPALRPDKPRPPHHPKNGLDPVRFKSAKLSQTQKDKTPGCKSRGSCFCNSPSRVNFSPSLGLLTLARR